MRAKKKFKFFCFVCAVAVVFCGLYASSNKILEEYGEKSFSAYISTASYSAFDELFNRGVSYGDLTTVDKNADGDIVMITTNGYLVNSVATEIAESTQKRLAELTSGGVGVPWGAFTGIRLVGGFGKKVKMKLITATSVKTRIVSTFEDAGINQTRHTLRLDLHCEAHIVGKFKSKTVSDDISMLVYDNLIVGKVPNVFLSSVVAGSGSA